MTLPTKLANVVRAEFEDTCKRRFFFGAGFDPYGGMGGLYDLGPPLCAVKANLLAFWRQHFILEEGMSEVDTTCATPHDVFKAVGHVDKFCDVNARDTVTGECVRVDKHIEEWCDEQLAKAKGDQGKINNLNGIKISAEDMDAAELGAVLKENKILSKAGNPLGEPFDFNLMFSSPMGAEGGKTVFFRPELAQGIILNFKRLMDSNNASTKLPWAAAAIGQAFRNEIAPRCNLLRVREFTLAEIEHFVDPTNKAHPKFDTVKDIKIWAITKAVQLEKRMDATPMTIGDAVKEGIIDNQTLGYFIGRAHLFLTTLGLKDDHIRWRQHVKLAHYAVDCWDAEALTTYGWYEIVGIADRSAHDLDAHMKFTKKDLTAREDYLNPVEEMRFERKPNKGVLGKKFGKNSKAVIDFVEGMPDDEAEHFAKKLQEAPVTVSVAEGQDPVEITKEMFTCGHNKVKVTGRNFTPSVVEPSFGIGRIMYALLEQSYYVRKDESGKGKNDKRAVFGFTPLIAPQKVAVLPLMVKPELLPIMAQLTKELIRAGLSNRSDDSGAAIGKKYARIDELGIPFVITCDFENDGCVTLRERDTAAQVRVPTDKVVGIIADMCNTVEPRSWDSVLKAFPKEEAKETKE